MVSRARVGSVPVDVYGQQHLRRYQWDDLRPTRERARLRLQRLHVRRRRRGRAGARTTGRCSRSYIAPSASSDDFADGPPGSQPHSTARAGTDDLGGPDTAHVAAHDIEQAHARADPGSD